MGFAAPLIGGGLSAVGGLLGGHKASHAQERAAQEQLALERQIYQQQRQDFAPYLQAGQFGLGGLQSLASPEGQQDFLNQFFGGQEYRTLADAANRNVLAQAAATHNLGSGTTAGDLERIAPTLGLQALGQQEGLYGQLAGLGRGGLSGSLAAGGQFGQEGASALGQLGAARAGGALAPFQALGAFGNQLSNYYQLQNLMQYLQPQGGTTFDPAIGAGVWQGGLYGGGA